MCWCYLKFFSVRGSFNGVFVNKKDVMLKKSPQTVTGTKTFAQNGNGLVEFKKINLSGNINGIRLNELIENQIYKNQDSVIDSALNFNRNVTTSGVYFEKSYNGVNVTDFVKKVVHFAEFNNIEVAFQNLLYLADTVEESLKSTFFCKCCVFFQDFFQGKRIIFQHTK